MGEKETGWVRERGGGGREIGNDIIASPLPVHKHRYPSNLSFSADAMFRYSCEDKQQLRDSEKKKKHPSQSWVTLIVINLPLLDASSANDRIRWFTSAKAGGGVEGGRVVVRRDGRRGGGGAGRVWADRAAGGESGKQVGRPAGRGPGGEKENRQVGRQVSGTRV